MTQRKIRKSKHILRSLNQLAVVLALWSLPFTLPLLAQVRRAALTEKQSQAVATIADYASSGNSQMGVLLADVGYKPDIPAFDAFPGIAQLESAYLAAELASPGSGDLLIATLSKRTAAKHESARSDMTLKYYLGLKTDEPPTFHFVTPASSPRPKQPVTKAIATLADYSEGNALGGPQAVLRDYFGLSSDQVYDLLRQHRTAKAAIIDGASWVPESERNRRFSLLVADLDRAYDGAVQAEKSLDEYRPKSSARKSEATMPFTRPEPDDHLNSDSRSPNVSPPSRGGGGGGVDVSPKNPASEPASLRNYEQYVHENYSVAPEPVRFSPGNTASDGIAQGLVQGFFEAVVEGAGGFGGIVFGNDVTQTPGLGKLRSIEWIADDSPSPNLPPRGRVLLNFDQAYDGTIRQVHRLYGPVLLEDAYAAYRIVFAPDGMPEWSKGRAIGIMGLYDKEDYVQCDVNQPPKGFDYWRILLNPALVNTELGQSAVLVDSLPIVQKPFGAMLKIGATPELVEQVDEWLDETPGTWKFIDRPMVISNLGERITVTPSAANSRSINRFIDVKSFDKDFDLSSLESSDDLLTQHDPFQDGFVQLFPLIVGSSHGFSRINGFAPVLALFRWAKVSGATMEKPIQNLAQIATPEAILIGNDNGSISPISDMSSVQVREAVRSNIDKCLSDLSKEFSPSVQDVLRQQQAVFHQASLDMEPAMAARAQRALLTDQNEYIENVARSLAGRTPSGRSALKSLMRAEQVSDDQDGSDELPRLQRAFIQRFYPNAVSTYTDIQERADKQESIVDKQTDHVQEQMSALNVQGLSAKLMAAVGGDAASRYAALQKEIDDANHDAEQLSKQIEQLEVALADEKDTCIRKLSTQLHGSYSALQTGDARLEFLQQHCPSLDAKVKQAEQHEVSLQKSQDAAEKADDDQSALLRETLPKLSQWKELCDLYLPSWFYL